TEIHHPHWWSRGGKTNLDNALPLCGHHHQRAHDTNLDLHRRPDGEWSLDRRRRPPGLPAARPDEASR
ncbi:MAG TPA: HNH endonuclease signature motif containing protein, partial [Nocardioides sp.]